MAWKYTSDGSTLLGVPARDLTDEEYAEYSVTFLEREGVTLAKTGFYVQEKSKAAATSEGE